ncbi:MAG: excinuclease ABC subunit UvrA [Phycisphaerales bacterium]
MPPVKPLDHRVIRVRGAREHNLKNLDVEIPRDQLVVLTGVSGSGKSSLAFDTIFAEGQRKYMESLSAYARQFLDQMQKPDIDGIEGLPPTIAIEQRTGGHSPRSTVATTTEIHDYLRVLLARCGEPTCWHRDDRGHTCGRPIARTDPSVLVDTLVASHPGVRAMVAAPVVRGRKGFHRDVLESLQRQGFMRARVDGNLVDLREALKHGGDNPLKLGRYETHDIEAVIDRIVIGPESRQRLAESLETALKAGDGNVVLLLEETRDGKGGDETRWIERRFSERFACPEHPECSIEELSPRLFSFNSPHGACPRCAGLGAISEFDLDLVVPDPAKGVASGAIEPYRRNGPRMNMHYARLLRKFCGFAGISRDLPFKDLDPLLREALLHGTDEHRESALGFTWEGVIPSLRRRYEETDSELVKERLRGYMTAIPCPECGGARLKPEALAVRIAGGGMTLNLAEIARLTISRALGFFESLELDAERRKIAAPVLKEIDARLGFLAAVGLEYLTLDRTSSTLSGGEAQRIRLATQVGSGLVGVCYVLDEPTIGLHSRDNDRLIATLRNLSRIGNTVLVVEHDEEMIRAADHVLDIGPGPGRHGGTVVAQGSVAEIASNPASLTGDYLAGRKGVTVPESRRVVSAKEAIRVVGASANNLRDVDVDFPLGGMVVVTGVSGSGKSTLVNEVLLKAAQREIVGMRVVPAAHRKVTGLSKLDRVIEVDQSPIGRTPRSNPATYTGILDEIRKLLALVPEAKIRGYQPGRFSFNVKGGRCETCQGQGVRRIEMHFLPDVFVTCETCKGRRFNRETLEVKFRGKSIADILDLTIEEAVEFFEAHPKVVRMLACLRDVGLGYVQLGQASTTLSGGEAQRVKLASELGLANSGRTLYVLDEPTTGLHFDDVRKLLEVLERLADAGHTLVVIEHNLEVIKRADWIIDLGPEGGDRGGTIVATGTPEEVAANPASHTGRFLKPLLDAKRVAAAEPRGPETATPTSRKAPASKSSASSKKSSKAPAKSPAKAAPTKAPRTKKAATRSAGKRRG